MSQLQALQTFVKLRPQATQKEFSEFYKHFREQGVNYGF